MGGRILKAGMIALAGLVVGYLAALGIGLVAFDVFDVSQREGAAAMGLLFFIAPAAAIACALIAGIWCWIASGRRTGATNSDPTPGHRKFPFLVVAAAAIAGWLAGLLLQWLLAGQSYDTFAIALGVAEAPWIGAIALAGLTWWKMRAPEAEGR